MIENFKLLTRDELNKFEKYVYSPFFNTHRSLVKLFNYLFRLHPVINPGHITKENLSLKIYGEKKINDLKIRKLLSDFSILMDKFLTTLEITENQTGSKILLLNKLRKKGFTKRFEYNFNQLHKEITKEFSKDRKYYLNMINLEDENFYFNFDKGKKGFAKCLQDKSNNLDYYYAFCKLHTFNEMLHSEGSRNKGKFYNKNFLKEIIAFIESNIEEISAEHPNLYIIYLVYMMHDTFNEDYLKKLKKYLLKNEKKFNKEKLSYYYHYITQYYIQKINHGSTKYREVVFTLYKQLKKKELLLPDKKITDNEFNNVVNTALAMKQYEWLNEFIEEYKKFLAPENSNAAYMLAKAKLMFSRKDYAKIFTYLNEIEFKEPHYYTNSKFLLGRVYFETNDFEGIRYMINNLRQYLRIKSSLSFEQMDAIKMYVKYMSELLKLNEDDPKEKKINSMFLKKQLENEKKFVPTKDWFYEKAGKV